MTSTSEKEVAAALDGAVHAFGGLDMLILNAGIFPGGKRIAELADDEWQRVMQVNLDANLALLRDCHPLLKIAPNGGRVVVIGSKNVPAPGPGAAAYSASKAALTQLARVAALEWGADPSSEYAASERGIRYCDLDRGSARCAGQTLRPIGCRLQNQ